MFKTFFFQFNDKKKIMSVGGENTSFIGLDCGDGQIEFETNDKSFFR